MKPGVLVDDVERKIKMDIWNTQDHPLWRDSKCYWDCFFSKVNVNPPDTTRYVPDPQSRSTPSNTD